MVPPVSGLIEIERRVLATCAKAPEWSQRLKHAKPIVDRLVRTGHLRRRPAAGSRVPLMVEITEMGRVRLAKIEAARK